jgi:hypothetical protein
VKDGWKRWIFDTVPKGNLMQAGKTPVLGGKNRHTVCRFWLAVPSTLGPGERDEQLHHEEAAPAKDCAGPIRFAEAPSALSRARIST